MSNQLSTYEKHVNFCSSFFICFLSFILLLIFYFTSATWAGEQKLKDIHIYHYKNEIIDKFSKIETINKLMQMARSGDCDAASDLGFFLKEKGCLDEAGNDFHYWLEKAAKCGNIPAMIEVGYSSNYSRMAKVQCADSRLEIITKCYPLENKIGVPMCYEQIFSFFDKKDTLLKTYQVKYNPSKEDRTISYAAYCISKNGSSYYVIESTDYGGSCCEWNDIFKATGEYIGTYPNPKQSLFNVQHKSLKSNLKKLFTNHNNIKEIQINNYPKF